MAFLILIDLRKVIDTASEFILTLQPNGREQFGFTGVSFRKRSGWNELPVEVFLRDYSVGSFKKGILNFKAKRN